MPNVPSVGRWTSGGQLRDANVRGAIMQRASDACASPGATSPYLYSWTNSQTQLAVGGLCIPRLVGS